MTVRFVHLSDLHLSHPDLNDPHLNSDTCANLKLAISQITGMDILPDFVVVSGDLTNQGDERSYLLLREFIHELKMPTIFALGNHDNRAMFRTAFKGIIDDGAPDAPYCHQAICNGLSIITLDSSVPGQVSGAICDAQLDFLEQALLKQPDLAKLLVVHHPPLIEQGPYSWDSLDRNSTDRLARTLQNQNVIGLLSGHIHINRTIQWNGIPIVISMGLHSTVDILQPSGMQILEGTGYCLCELHGSGLSATFIPLTPQKTVLRELPDELLRSFK